ncbi:MAG: YggS family pyridoxal phosphate-dependent enzyme [Planctomycetales bacterium]|nr:YggS family pyridoxal phosphate-dependent enzyme [Planctomycetales bacterium]
MINSNMAEIISQNWQSAIAAVSEACAAAGRRYEEVTIVGVTKYVAPELAWQLSCAGCKILGENRPQSLWEKYEYFKQQTPDANEPACQWHLIGHLQRNKARRTLPMLSCLESLDSLRLAESVSSLAQDLNIELDVLLEVNITQDASKTGLTPQELQQQLPHFMSLPGLRLAGLMAMATLGANGDAARCEFAAVRQLRDTLSAASGLELSKLSMGMSGDFREAIAEGATQVRLGTLLWDRVITHD